MTVKEHGKGATVVKRRYKITTVKQFGKATSAVKNDGKTKTVKSNLTSGTRSSVCEQRPVRWREE